MRARELVCAIVRALGFSEFFYFREILVSSGARSTADNGQTDQPRRKRSRVTHFISQHDHDSQISYHFLHLRVLETIFAGQPSPPISFSSIRGIVRGAPPSPPAVANQRYREGEGWRSSTRHWKESKVIACISAPPYRTEE